MAGAIKNLRIHFYGVQGSGAVFPTKAERDEIRRVSDLELLEQVFAALQRRTDPDGFLKCRLDDILGGSVDRAALEGFRNQLSLEEVPVYGGWTTCFRIETSDGHDIVFDCGSGFRICAFDLEKKWQGLPERQLSIFGSHAHFDHTEGFDQADVCFNPKNHIHVYANESYLTALDQFSGVFSHQVNRDRHGRQTPLTYELMPANFTSTEIRDLDDRPPALAPNPAASNYHDVSQPITIGETTIQSFEVFHPDPCLAYRVEHKGKVFVYCTDHELRHGVNPSHPLQVASLAAEERLAEHSMNADVLYRDGQFLRTEYDGDKPLGSETGVSRRDWGHSCIEDVVAMAKQCNIKQTFIGHHDPSRSWSEQNSIDEMLRCQSKELGINVELAKAETIVDI